MVALLKDVRLEPGYYTMPGNEKADELTRNGVESVPLESEPILGITRG